MKNILLSLLQMIIVGAFLVYFDAPRWAFYIGVLFAFWLNMIYGELIDLKKRQP